MANNDFCFSNNNTIIIGLKNKNLKFIVIPEGVKEIAKSAFSDQKIIHVSFPESLEKISDGAFEVRF